MNVSRGRLAPLLLAFLGLLAGVEFLVRGPASVSRGNDFGSPYISAVRFLHGKNPYASTNFLAEWHAQGGPADQFVDVSVQHPVYPPTALVVLAPVAVLRWKAALYAYTYGCTLAYLVLVALLFQVVLKASSLSRGLAFLIFALALSPIHAGFKQANLSVLVVVLDGFALYLASKNKDASAGVLASIAFALKPTGGMAVALVLLLSLRKRAIASFIALFAAIAAIAFAVMSRMGSAWKADYQANVQFLFGPSGAANFASSGARRFDLVNLQLPFHELTASRPAANVLALVTTSVLTAAWLAVWLRRRQSHAWDWPMASTLVLLSLLPVYQRNYNAAAVLFSAVWMFARLGRRWAALLAIPFALFLIPGEAILRVTNLATRFAGNVFWNTFVMPQLTWSLVVIIVASLWLAHADARARASAQAKTDLQAV